MEDKNVALTATGSHPQTSKAPEKGQTVAIVKKELDSLMTSVSWHMSLLSRWALKRRITTEHGDKVIVSMTTINNLPQFTGHHNKTN